MARRRMFTTELIDSDRFTDMPVQTQMLYISLSMHADDEGFVSAGKRLAKQYGGVENLDILEQADFIIRFPSGVVLVVDWLINNTIRKDRSANTVYQMEREMVTVEQGRYVLVTKCQPGDNQMTTNCQPFCNQVATQNRKEDKRKENNIVDHNRPEYSEVEKPLSPVAEKADRVCEKETKEPEASDDFVIPTMVEVFRYAIDNKIRKANPVTFYNYYDRNGWADQQGKPIKDWKAMLHNWEQNEIPVAADTG